MEGATVLGIKIVHKMRPQKLVDLHFDRIGREGDVDFRQLVPKPWDSIEIEVLLLLGSASNVS